MTGTAAARSLPGGGDLVPSESPQPVLSAPLRTARPGVGCGSPSQRCTRVEAPFRGLVLNARLASSASPAQGGSRRFPAAPWWARSAVGAIGPSHSGTVSRNAMRISRAEVLGLVTVDIQRYSAQKAVSGVERTPRRRGVAAASLPSGCFIQQYQDTPQEPGCQGVPFVTLENVMPGTIAQEIH